MREILKDGFSQLGINALDEVFLQFEKYANFLIEYNEKVNLTAITEPGDIAVKHFLDSVTPVALGLIKEGASVIDVGSGAGFPSVPIKLVSEDIQLTLLDSLDKRLKFLKGLCELLKIEGVSFVHARAEEGGKMPDLRENFDIAISRAVANLRVLCEYCLPYVKVGGQFLALKGPSAEQEVLESKKAIEVLGGRLVDVLQVNVPCSDLNHTIVRIEKVRQTPRLYPRNAGKPSKNPI
jgi:16S rRNA (guanine(527)-N(7))-methyltransferase GidB